jgi:hypothetical protein
MNTSVCRNPLFNHAGPAPPFLLFQTPKNNKMKNKKSFRIKKSAKLDSLVNQSSLLQKTLQKIVGGRTNQAKGVAYGRVVGLYEQNA